MTKIKIKQENYPNLKVGCMIGGIFSHAYTCDPKDEAANQKFDELAAASAAEE